MLRKRIIFTLIYSDGFFVQSRNFRLQKVGDISWLENNYHLQKTSFYIDELIVVNASRKNKSIIEFSKIVSRLSEGVFIPLAVGGGIQSEADAEILFNSGADKIVLNSNLWANKNLIKILVDKYGSQALVASVDYKKKQRSPEVFIRDGAEKIDLPLVDYVQYLEGLNIGEIYLNSIDQDGTGFGYDFDVINQIKNFIKIPLIIAGGAGNKFHLMDGLMLDNVSAVATANLFNFVGDGFQKAREMILASNINIATWG